MSEARTIAFHMLVTQGCTRSNCKRHRVDMVKRYMRRRGLKLVKVVMLLATVLLERVETQGRSLILALVFATRATSMPPSSVSYPSTSCWIR